MDIQADCLTTPAYIYEYRQFIHHYKSSTREDTVYCVKFQGQNGDVGLSIGSSMPAHNASAQTSRARFVHFTSTRNINRNMH
jgi:hypothetical protein